MNQITQAELHPRTRYYALPLLLLLLTFGASPESARGQWVTNGNNINNTNSGNVGVGTTTPTAKLDVRGSGNFQSGNETFGVTVAYPGGGVGGDLLPRGTLLSTGFLNDNMQFSHLTLIARSDTAHAGDKVSIMYGLQGTGTWYSALEVANVMSGRGNLQLMKTGGKVTIGTPSSPVSDLEVNGNVNISGNINAKYQDVAEWVESSQKLEAGTVVALDPERSNQVLASSEAYDTRVAGVISAQPGISLGERGEGKVLVATTGRVKVRVDATRAPIKIGDLLVTSDIVGVAMKSEAISIGGRRMHAPGTLIGKALEPLAKGAGEILVLLSLQ